MFRTALFAATAVLSLSAGAEAQSSRCRVMDPTGTPLNLRDRPNGQVIGQLRNGMLVETLRNSQDDRGRAWVYVQDRANGEPLGWVFREFIACF